MLKCLISIISVVFSVWVVGKPSERRRTLQIDVKGACNFFLLCTRKLVFKFYSCTHWLFCTSLSLKLRAWAKSTHRWVVYQRISLWPFSVACNAPYLWDYSSIGTAQLLGKRMGYTSTDFISQSRKWEDVTHGECIDSFQILVKYTIRKK